jgi:hypothetical protein
MMKTIIVASSLDLLRILLLTQDRATVRLICMCVIAGEMPR